VTSVLFVQGAGDMHAPEGSGVLADYLQRELGSGFQVVAPEMPDASSDPNYDRWAAEIAAQLKRLDGPVLLVGHSLGGSVLLKYLASTSPRAAVSGLFLVSVPWWGPEGWAYDDYAVANGFASGLPNVPIFLYNSRDDPIVPYDHQQLYLDRIPGATARTIEGSEHSFVNGLPELISDIRGSSLT